MRNIIHVILFSVIFSGLAGQVARPADLVKKESLNLLVKLCDRLVTDQVTAPADSHFGAIRNPESVALSEASEEAVFPLAIAFKITNQKKYGTAALRSANRNLRQYLKTGFKSENLTGASVHQLLSNALAYPILARHFPPEIQSAWKKLFTDAGQTLQKDLAQRKPRTSTELALIAASLAALHQIQPDHHWRAAAEKAAFTVISRMTPEGFIAETDFLAAAETTAIAPGTTFEITLPALAIFSSLLPQERLSKNFVNALSEYLYLIYPNGMLDYAWGAGSGKISPIGNFDGWGSQAAFCLFAAADSRFYAAANRNLAHLGQNLFSETMIGVATNLPRIRRAFGLALTLSLPSTPPSENKVLPADIVGWFRHFKSQNLVVIRTANYMATVSGYGFAENEVRSGGGMLSTLWCKDAGLLQTATPNHYTRESSYFPEWAVEPLPLSSRIECAQDDQIFSNLFDVDCRVKSRQTGWQDFQVRAAGELKNQAQESAGVKYLLNYYFSANQIKKDLRLNYSGKKTEVRIVEPFQLGEKTEITRIDEHSVVIKNPRGTWRLQIEAGEAEIEIGFERERYRWPLSGGQSTPITIKVMKGKQGERRRVVYRLEKISTPGRQLADFRIE